MANPILKVTDLSKRYRIGAADKGGKTFNKAVADWVSAPFRNFDKLWRMTRFQAGEEPNTIWALKDVSFEVKEGEALGIIGRNGSGKSTLLKILSRITEPTSGCAEIYGRVSSLLEVGTGFHPELTGRENIYLNGAILGMKKREIENKFNDIVNFSEIEKYIDTPVKRYSSGMYVRLAFAVAAHLDPEIMLLDEVLAVGDMAFQKKCLGKMDAEAKSGRTILFVSHNMGAVRSLCSTAIWLDNGQVVKRGPADEVVRAYEQSQLTQLDEKASFAVRPSEDVTKKAFYFSRVEIVNEKGEQTNLFRYKDKLTLLVSFPGTAAEDYSIGFYIYDESGQAVSFGVSGTYHNIFFNSKVKKIGIDIGPLIITSGKYRISLGAGSKTAGFDRWENAIGFTITECQPFERKRDIPAATEGSCILQQVFRVIEE